MADRMLLLLRHAKSSWDDAALSDFDRPLAARGREAAPRMGKEMARRGWLPDMAIVSPARRTRQTWELVAAELPRQPDASFDQTIYEAPARRILAAIRRVPERVRCLLVVGHNPGLEELAPALASQTGNADALARLGSKYPTAALACFGIRSTWLELDENCAHLVAFLTPKDVA